MNRIYLTCKHHPTQAESFGVASRNDDASYSCALVEARSLQKWLDKHAACGGTFDHFTLSYAQEKDADVPKSNPVSDAVHAALREVK